MKRNDKKQGKRMMRKTYLMCDKEKDNEGQQPTINNQYKENDNDKR